MRFYCHIADILYLNYGIICLGKKKYRRTHGGENVTVNNMYTKKIFEKNNRKSYLKVIQK